MDLGLKGKVAFVAAASQGLGRAVAEELAREGASLILNSRSSEKITAVCSDISRTTDVEAYPAAGDLSNTSELERAVREGLDHFGKIDILVTNIGGPPAGTFENLSRDAWTDACQSLLMSVIDLSRLVLPGMKERRWGRILNVTSISVKQPVDNLILSNSLRSAVTGFSKTLSNEVAEYGITVNNILPGYTLTERLEQLARSVSDTEGIGVDAAKQRWESQIPMKRLGRPDEFAALAAFLVSERASYMTGTSIPVDGGWIRSLL
jgi:3-oxoacyl-[acyl-carrier protein] reductase